MAQLKQLGSDLKRIDNMIVDLIQRRMELAKLVGFEKMRRQQPMFRSEIEDQRLDEIADYASSIGVNPNMARTILYSLINESCKQQTILLQNDDASDLEMLDGEERIIELRGNLLRLAEVIAPNYEDVFYGEDFFSKIYTSYEKDRLADFITDLPDHDLALDLGCGTGHVSIMLNDQFKKIVGFDVSQHMQYHATLNAERKDIQNIEFRCADVESGLPFPDSSVSFVNMNYGVASDFMDLPTLLKEVVRVLKSSGGLFMSFYNKDAISQKFGFLPWKTNMISGINPYTNCLDVSIGGEQYPVHAKLYTLADVHQLLEPDFTVTKSSSYPFFSSILPSEIIQALDNADDLEQLESQIDHKKNNLSGSYLICEATKR